MFKNGIITLASRPGVGKTALALQIALNTAAIFGKEVLFYSLEMTEQQIFDRIDRMIQYGGESTKMYAENKSQIIVEDNMVDVLNHVTPSAIAERINSENNKPALVVIDYVQLLAQKPFSRESNILQIASELSAISRESNTPILVLSQLPRIIDARKDKRPLLSDLNFAEKSDTVLMLYRGLYYNIQEQSDKAELIVSKSQNGKCGTIKLNFDKEALTFKKC